MDTFDKMTRSAIMRRVKSRNTAPEKYVLRAIRSARLSGWRRHYGKAFGTPDFAFPKQRVAIFIDGCFWHGCPKCLRRPKSNVDYWDKKVSANIARAKLVNRVLRDRGWKTLRIWEHSVQCLPEKTLAKIVDLVRHTKIPLAKTRASKE